MRIRTSPDGSIFLPRNDPRLERELDATFYRVKGELRWFPKPINPLLTPQTFENDHIGQICYFFGKGPSLDFVTSEIIPENAVCICINESIRKIETLDLHNMTYCVQQDASLKSSCVPKHAVHFLSINARGWNPAACYYDPRQFGLLNKSLSILMAIKLARLMGMSEFVFCGFDACITAKTTYASCVGYKPEDNGQPANRFLWHKARILAACKECKIKWLDLTTKKPVWS